MAVTVAMMTCLSGAAIPSSAQAGEKFGGVEIGAKGIKVSAVEIDPGGPSPGLKVLELDNQTVNLTISRLKNKAFNQVLIGDVAAVVADFCKALQEKLGVPEANIQVVASSGVPFVDNFTDLAVAIRDRTGKDVGKIDASEEAMLTAMAIVPPEIRARAIVIDIGSGNLKGGVFVDPGGAPGSFRSISVPFGTTTLARAIAAKADGTPPGPELFREVARQSIGLPLAEQVSAEPGFAGRDIVLLSGGSAWAFVTIMKPETATDPFPKVTYPEITAYQALVEGAAGRYPSVDFARVADPAARRAAEADYARICGSTGDAPPVFKPEELRAGAALLDQVGEALSFDERKVFFDRKALTAWITAKITFPEYRDLLPAAFNRAIPTEDLPQRTSHLSSPAPSPEPIPGPSPQMVIGQAGIPSKVLPTPQMVINPSGCGAILPAGGWAVVTPRGLVPESPEDLIAGRDRGDWEALFHRGLDALRASDPRAIDFFAAAAELSDDPRAWTYLSLALMNAGDAHAARRASRYAAARMIRSPGQERQLAMLFERMHDPAREYVIGWQNEVRQEPPALAMGEPRPVLFARRGRSGDNGLTLGRPAAAARPSRNR